MWQIIFRACLKTTRDVAAKDFGSRQGGEVGASPQRAVTTEPTRAKGKGPAARRVFSKRPSGFVAPQSKIHEGYSLVPVRKHSRLAIRPFAGKQHPRLVFKLALSGLFHKYTHVRCAAFEPGRGATKEHSRKRFATEEQQSPGSNAAQPSGRQFFSPQPSWLAPHSPLAGMLVACASAGAKIPCREPVRIYEIDYLGPVAIKGCAGHF